jgi:hypothetical protein
MAPESQNWNFRSLLDVDPDKIGFTCVGIGKTTGKRCGQKLFATWHLRRAADILDTMDTLQSLSDASLYLEELAELTLCGLHHRHPGVKCQVESVIERWEQKIMEKSLQKERKKKTSVYKCEKAVPGPSVMAKEIKLEEKTPQTKV